MEDWNIRAMLDSLEETGVYVIEQNTHRLLYFNRRIKDVTPDVQLGVKCHELWEGTCSDCPLLTIGAVSYTHLTRKTNQLVFRVSGFISIH